MEEQKSPTPVLPAIKALAQDCAAPIPRQPEFHQAILRYKDQSQKRPPPSFLGKRMYFSFTMSYMSLKNIVLPTNQFKEGSWNPSGPSLTSRPKVAKMATYPPEFSGARNQRVRNPTSHIVADL